MAQAANTWADDAPTERRPGDFQRSKTGTPYVADPDGATVKSGKRAGLAKMLAYGRPSGFGKQIEDTYNLSKWSERTVALGLGIDCSAACERIEAPELVTKAAALAGRDREANEWKSDADAIVVEAKRIAQAGLAAERGTQAHALTEDHDEERDWITRAEAGEVLGMDTAVQRSLVEAWRQMLATQGLEVLATEFAMVHDTWRMAGTGDRIVRLTRDLRFALVTGEVVTLAAGTVIVLDIKTGKHRTDPKGVVMYWQSYAVQIATYAGGCLYDPDTDTRSPYPWPVDQHWALIAHLDVLGAIEGKPACRLVLVDLEAGRMAAELCMAAKAWEKRADVFSVSQIDDAPPCVVTAEVVDDASAEIAPDVTEPERQGDPALQEACPPPAAPTVSERRAALPHGPDRPAPDEGAEVDAATMKRLEVHFGGLGPLARKQLAAIGLEAQQAHVGFHCSKRTLRRFEITRALVTLAYSDVGVDDEWVRALIALALDSDAPLFPAVTLGHAVGSLDATTAARFAALVDSSLSGRLMAWIDDSDSLFRLVEMADAS